MALMIPDEVARFTTEGEGKFYRFLSAAAKPNNAYLAWYLPDIHGKEPDFILYSDSIGLVVFEVKDWVLDQIREANPHQFTLEIADDLHPASEICSDPSGNCFLKTLNERFPPMFRFSASPKDVQHLKQLLFPEVRIELPNRVRTGGYAEQAERLKILDHNQEALARQFDGGHRIIVGASGSGKTLVLAHKAGFLQRYNPAIKSIPTLKMARSIC